MVRLASLFSGARILTIYRASDLGTDGLQCQAGDLQRRTGDLQRRAVVLQGMLSGLRARYPKAGSGDIASGVS